MSDKTEKPTHRRMEEAREEGQVAFSRELNTAAVLLVGAFLLRGPGGQLAKAMQAVITHNIAEMPAAELTNKWIAQNAYWTAGQLLGPLGTFMAALLLVGVAATLGQTRFLWSSKSIGFKLNRLNPLNGLKRIFSARGLVELVKALLKLGLVGWVAYSFLRSNYTAIVSLIQFDLPTAILKAAELTISLAVRVGGTYVVLAAADYAYQRWDLMRNLRMTKEELKEEYKRSEGDPMLKARIRGQMRRMARNRMMANVPKATVIVTNPTHLAIAIEYKEGMAAPRVLAKGAMRVAQKIVSIAREHGIPVVQNIPLARAIYKTVDIEQEISPELYLAMAEVLAHVYKLRGRVAAGQPA